MPRSRRHRSACSYPALAHAARTVGSPQIRNAGTIGGNVAMASPAGDTLPVLAALDATIELQRVGEVRLVPWHEFFIGPKKTTRRDDELVVAVHVPVRRGPQSFMKVGTRNAMVIAVASVCLAVDLDERTVRCGLGAVGPVPLRARVLPKHGWSTSSTGTRDTRAVRADASLAREFGRRVGRSGASDRRSSRHGGLPSPCDRGVRRACARPRLRGRARRPERPSERRS